MSAFINTNNIMCYEKEINGETTEREHSEKAMWMKWKGAGHVNTGRGVSLAETSLQRPSDQKGLHIFLCQEL